MKTFVRCLSYGVVVLGFGAQTFAQAGTLQCSSVGQGLAANRLVINATLEKTWTGKITGGKYGYYQPKSQLTGAGRFICEANAQPDGVTLCALMKSDTNIRSIFVHPTQGLAFEITEQSHIAYLNCK